ncbi:hypothetical protein [Halorientalis marina]|uniref:hypothetical protein n=1 Tax=Halorientalis marina TaxID=2931976 RepID=UPI001FF51825|nr:hypothetical protein [Halorientalis marina]
MPSVSVSDHLRPTDGDVPAGIYRVVGVGAESVTLLRVGDADGTRVHTGEVVTVTREDLDAFETAANPDGSRSVAAALVRGPEHLYWSVRAFAGQLAASPLLSAGTLAVVVAGAFGEGVLPLSEAGLDALVVAGALGLALVGSGRL